MFNSLYYVIPQRLSRVVNVEYYSYHSILISLWIQTMLKYCFVRLQLSFLIVWLGYIPACKNVRFCPFFLQTLGLCLRFILIIYNFINWRSMNHGAKDIWNCIKRWERTGRGYIGMRVIPKSLLKIMQTMILLKMMMKISLHTG